MHPTKQKTKKYPVRTLCQNYTDESIVTEFTEGLFLLKHFSSFTELGSFKIRILLDMTFLLIIVSEQETTATDRL